MTADPIRPAETDEEPWNVVALPVRPPTRWGWAVVLAFIALAALAAAWSCTR